MPASRIVKVEVSRRGPQGAIDPQDRARFDRAVEVAETVDAVVETVTQAEGAAVQASTAAQQAAQTAAQDAAAAIAPAAADAIRAQVAADADRAAQAAAAVPALERTVGSKVDLGDWDSPLLASLVTDNGMVLAGARDRGGVASWEAPEMRADRGTFAGAVIEDHPEYESDAALVIIDSQGRIGLEVGTASLAPDPAPAPTPTATPYIAGEGLLRFTRQRRIARTLAADAQLVIAHIGDSWTYNWTYWAQGWAEILAARYGDAGEGWIGFGRKNDATAPHGSARRRATPTYSSDTTVWTTSYNTTLSPDLSGATSAIPGEWISVTLPAGTTGATLFALGTADGQARYQIDGGGWTALPLTGSGPLFVPLAGITGANTVRIEVVSGTVTLLGIDAVSSAPGVRIHKLGGAGSNTVSWVAVDAAGWQAQLARLAPHLVTILHGTNDQGDTAENYAQRLTTLVGRVRAAMPYADVLIVAPPENAMGRTRPMSAYQDAAYQVATSVGAAYLNLQPAFGPGPDFYKAGGTGFLHPDNVHPSTTGGQAIIGALLEVTNL